MKIHEVREGSKVFIKTVSNTERRHGTNDRMLDAVGTYQTVDRVGDDYVEMIGCTWHTDDLSHDDVKPIINVPLSGKKMKIDPKEIF